MAKPFAAGFYRSKAWQLCRLGYIAARQAIDGGMCEDCGERPGEELHHKQELTVSNINDGSVTLDHDNLIWLCKDCHFKAHRELIMSNFEKRKVCRVVNDAGYYFDDDGVMRQAKTYIVYGSPASGKTSYVTEHRQAGDLVVDLDLLKQAISMCPRADAPVNLLPVAIGIRDYIYELIEAGAIDCKNVWVIASLPRRKEREELRERLNAELVYVESSYHECIDRVNHDDSRKDKQFERYLVDRWWETYEA